MFHKPFSFDGRIRRTEYGISFIIYFIIALIINAIGAGGQGSSFVYIAYVPLLWFFLAQGAKRCHDRDNSGWYQIIPFYVFWLLFAESVNGINEYGANPKGLDNQEPQTVKNYGNNNLTGNVGDSIDILRAVSNNNSSEVARYIKNGGNLEVKDQWGNSALTWGCHYGFLEMVKLLIDANANVNAKDSNGQTALMKVSDKGNINLVNILIKGQARVNEKDIRGQTALIMASQNGHLDVVKSLIEAKADINIKDNEGLTALEWATLAKHTDLKNILSATLSMPVKDMIPTSIVDDMQLKNQNEKNLSIYEIVDELIKLYDSSPKGEGYYKDSNEAIPIRTIGETLNNAGGMELMLQAHTMFSGKRYNCARNLEIVWGGIGSWRS
jgi:uncharacterized membrane protein YhaH (DUF805 family)